MYTLASLHRVELRRSCAAGPRAKELGPCGCACNRDRGARSPGCQSRVANGHESRPSWAGCKNGRSLCKPPDRFERGVTRMCRGPNTLTAMRWMTFLACSQHITGCERTRLGQHRTEFRRSGLVSLDNAAKRYSGASCHHCAVEAPPVRLRCGHWRPRAHLKQHARKGGDPTFHALPRA